MMLKLNSGYLDFNGDIEMILQSKTVDTLETSGDFSFEFSLPPTGNNIGKLDVKVNSINKSAYRMLACSIEDYGNKVRDGYLRVERSTREGIFCSFFSGNFNWFNIFGERKMFECDMSEFREPRSSVTPSSIITSSWADTEWITYPLLDTGALQDAIRTNLEDDFTPVVYIKSVMFQLFQKNGLKLSGDLLKDTLYNILVATSNAVDGDEFTMAKYSFYAGKTAVQGITTVASKVTFPILTFPFFEDEVSAYVNSIYTAPVNLGGEVDILLNLDSSETWTLEIYVNGISEYSITKTSAQIRFTFSTAGLLSDELNIDEDDEVEIYLSIAAGTTNITDGSWRFTVNRLADVYPQSMFSSMTQKDFIRSIFTMFNVIATYDDYTKTVTCNLMAGLNTKPEQDFSEFAEGSEIDFTQIISDFGRLNVFKHLPDDGEDTTAYNKQSKIPYGAGSIESPNDFTEGLNEISTEFTAPFSYYNKNIEANLLKLGYYEFTYDDEVIVISSAADDGGFVEFTTATDHGFEQLDFIYIRSTSTGEYVGLGRVRDVDSTTQFTVQRVDWGGTTVTGEVSKATRTIIQKDNVFIMANIANMAVSDFSGRSTQVYSTTAYVNMSYAYFLKTNLNLPIDDYRESPAFGNPEIPGFSMITLKDKYYQVTVNIINDPTQVVQTMFVPKATFLNIDVSKPVRVRTADFDGKFFLQRIEGYLGSDKPCTFYLVKI